MALWTPRVGTKAAQSVVSAGRVSAWALLWPVGLVVEFIGYHAGSDRVQQVGLPFVLVGGAAMLVGAMLRRRAARRVRAALGIAADDNRMGPGELPPSHEVAFQSWLRRMTTRPSDAEPLPAYAEAPSWSVMAPAEPILSHSCMRCVVRPKPHGRCGHKNCACARSGHCGWLGPRPGRRGLGV